MTKATFIVSAYSRPLALRLCLSALVLQTEPDWEAIVTDNSPDEAIRAQHEEFCRMDSRIRYVHTAAIDSYYAADQVIDQANGEWVGFPSDDSWYSPYYLAKLLAHASQNDLELVFCDLVMEGPATSGVLHCEATCCMIDKTNFLLKRSRFVPFPAKNPNGTGSCSDGELINELRRQGIRFGKLSHLLAVHV